MKIAVLTLYTEEIAEHGRLSAANKKAYAERHGYDFLLYRQALDTYRPPAWSKILALQAHLPDYDWIFWTDADSLVMNPAKRLESIIRGRQQKDMILTWEVGAARINTGQWLIRNSRWSTDALAAIADPSCPNSRPLWFEQGALIDWLESDPRRWDRLAVLHPRVMNSTPDVAYYPDLDLRHCRYREGDFIIHFWPLARRQDEVRRMMERCYALSLSQRPGLWRRLALLARRSLDLVRLWSARERAE